MAQPSDPYRALGVSRNATEAEIKAAHRKLAKRYHPDTEKGDTTRFLSVQEAYRVLSDPLLRREWDARHAPGPVRADRPAAPPAPRRRSAPTPAPAPAPMPSAEPSGSAAPPPREPDPRARPRSSRAYTWSASEVPWWEEANLRADRRQPGRRRPRAGSTGGPAAGTTTAGAQAGAAPDEPQFSPTQDFDVYNRSSGAAWSMAARAYFRRGDQELPRRGSFHHQGTQPLTAARARAAAEQEARRRAKSPPMSDEPVAESTAQPRPGSAPPAPSTQATPPPRAEAAPPPRSAPATPPGSQPAAPPPTARRTAPAAAWAAAGAGTTAAASAREARGATQAIVRRSVAAPWPTLTQRLVFALVAWLPIAALAVYAGSVAQTEEIGMLVLIGSSLVLLVAVPRLAYIASVATIGLLVVGAIIAMLLAVAGVRPPLGTGVVAAIGGALALGYVAIAGMVALGPPGLRPWTARPAQPVRNR